MCYSKVALGLEPEVADVEEACFPWSARFAVIFGMTRLLSVQNAREQDQE